MMKYQGILCLFVYCFSAANLEAGTPFFWDVFDRSSFFESTVGWYEDPTPEERLEVIDGKLEITPLPFSGTDFPSASVDVGQELDSFRIETAFTVEDPASFFIYTALWNSSNTSRVDWSGVLSEGGYTVGVTLNNQFDWETQPAFASEEEITTQKVFMSAEVRDGEQTLKVWLEGSEDSAGTTTDRRVTSDVNWVNVGINPDSDFSQKVLVDHYALLPLVVGDYNASGNLDAADIDLLADQLRTPDPDRVRVFDVNGDGITDLADHGALVTDLFDVLPGDANLDGEIGFDDFLVLSSNFGGVGGWAEGDFDASGDVAFADFLVLSGNFNAAPSFQPVPEPSGFFLYLIGSLILVRRKRTRRTTRIARAPRHLLPWTERTLVRMGVGSVAFLLAMLPTGLQAQTFALDTFEDGNYQDGVPFTWRTDGDVSSGDLVITASEDFSASLLVDENYGDATVRSKLRVLSGPDGPRGEVMFISRFLNPQNAYFAGFGTGLGEDDTVVFASRVNDRVKRWETAVTGIDPTAQDVWLELSSFGSLHAIRVWEHDAERPVQPQLLVRDVDLQSGTPGIFVDTPGGEGSTTAAFRSFEVSELIRHPADFDLDGLIGTDDFSTLCRTIRRGSGGAHFDLNQDATISEVDATFFISEAGWIPGDINLDGSVDFNDFLTLSQNFGSTPTGYWADGDFNCDREVSFADFLLLSSNFAGGTELVASVPEAGRAAFVMLLPVFVLLQTVRGSRKLVETRSHACPSCVFVRR